MLAKQGCAGARRRGQSTDMSVERLERSSLFSFLSFASASLFFFTSSCVCSKRFLRSLSRIWKRFCRSWYSSSAPGGRAIVPTGTGYPPPVCNRRRATLNPRTRPRERA